MKLVLYGGGDGDLNYTLNLKLLNLTGKKNPKFVFVPACCIHADEDFDDIVFQYKTFGIKKILRWDIDRPYSITFKDTVFNADIIYLGGGNTYYFLKHLKQKNLVTELRRWVLSGGILAGLSAGAILMSKNIETAGFPSFDRDVNDENLNNLLGLDLVEFDFFPHYRNSKRYDNELKAFSMKDGKPLYACPDGSGIIVSENQISFVGKAACFINGQKFFINKK